VQKDHSNSIWSFVKGLETATVSCARVQKSADGRSWNVKGGRKMKWTFAITYAVLLFFWTYGMTSPACHPAFPDWQSYSYFYKRIAFHGVSGAERVRGVFYFTDKQGRRCKL